jgi:OFA family oxalate/formate antiporter-like MFS transporter
MLGHDPVWFVILSGFVFFAWGESTRCSLDLHGYVRRQIRHHQCGPAHGKGYRGVAGTDRKPIQQSSGNWDNVFIIAAGASISPRCFDRGAETLAQTVVEKATASA